MAKTIPGPPSTCRASGTNVSQDIEKKKKEKKKYFYWQMRADVVVTGPTGLNISHEKERLKRERDREGKGEKAKKRPSRWVARMSGLSEWMTDRQQPDRRVTARRRADSLPLYRAFVTSSITGYRTCWSLSHSSTKSERTSDFVPPRLTGSMIIFKRTRIAVRSRSSLANASIIEDSMSTVFPSLTFFCRKNY